MLHTLGQSVEKPASTAQTAAVGVIIPTYNAAEHWPALHASLQMQGLAPEQVLIVDSSSRDNTRALAEQSGYRVVRIDQADFGHSRTRQFACSLLPSAELLLFITQDVVLNAPNSIQILQKCFDDPSVGAAYGRQLARPQANAIERHARLFNYPPVGQVRDLESRRELGFKAAFLSNSFGMYRRTALESVGGFPDHVIFAEDSYVTARLLLAGWRVAYAADATVVHSHGFTPWQEFQRYFDIGVHHQRESWMLKAFGNVGGEGFRFVKSELRYLRAEDKALLPSALLRTCTKWLGYKLGALSHRLPASVNRKLSSYPSFWPV